LPSAGHCWQCGRFYEIGGGEYLCSECLGQPPLLAVHRSALPYQGVLREIILLFKFKEYRCLARPLTELALKMTREDENLWAGVEMLVPVPLHPQREKERGFNQAKLLAGVFAKYLGLPWEAKVLKKVINSPPQSSVEGKNRWVNVRNVFQVRKRERVAEKVICLVDDVYTTGATLNECARVLLRAGAKEVRAITIARA